MADAVTLPAPASVPGHNYLRRGSWSVYTRRRWIDSWMIQPRIRFREAAESLAPGISTASFEYDFGRVKASWKTGLETILPVELAEQFVRVIHTSAAVTAAQLSAFNTEVAGDANFAYSKLVGSVLNDASKDFELPRAIAGGSVGDRYIPTFSMISMGTFTANNAAQDVTGIGGFLPDFVMCFPQASNSVCYIKTSNMGTTYSKGIYFEYPDTSWSTTFITALGYDQFSAHGSTNWNGKLVDYIAVKIHKPAALTP